MGVICTHFGDNEMKQAATLFYILKSFKVEVRYQRVIVVKCSCNKGVNKALCSFQCEVLTNHTNIAKMEESRFTNRGHVKDHTERLIKYNTHVTYVRRTRCCVITYCNR